MRARSMRMVTILILLLVALLSTNSVGSSSQQESVIPNQGTILVLDDFADTIFFEYGAETGVLEPHWDIAGGSGSGSQGNSYIRVDNTHVRTGNQAVKFYSEPPPKDDMARRMVLRLWNTGHKEIYMSWWLYLDSIYSEDTSPWGTMIGAVNAWFGPPENMWYWLTSARFYLSQTRRIATSYRLPFWPEGVDTWEYYDTVRPPLNEWLHFQIYVRWAVDNTGVYRWWYNGNLVREVTGIKTDPEGYGEWESDYGYVGGAPYPAISVLLYYDTDSPEKWYWVDDIVGATEKVPETYRVTGK